MAGPAMAPVCQAAELSAIAWGRISFGTRLGASAPSAGPAKARATPSSAATPNRIGRLMNPPHVATNRISAHSRPIRPAAARSASERRWGRPGISSAAR